MGSRFRVIAALAVLSAMASFPALASANPANAPGNTEFGPAVATGAQVDGGIGTSASFLAGIGLVEDSVLFSLGITPPGNPYTGPQPPPICGAGCGGGI